MVSTDPADTVDASTPRDLVVITEDPTGHTTAVSTTTAIGDIDPTSTTTRNIHTSSTAHVTACDVIQDQLDCVVRTRIPSHFGDFSMLLYRHTTSRLRPDHSTRILAEKEHYALVYGGGIHSASLLEQTAGSLAGVGASAAVIIGSDGGDRHRHHHHLDGRSPLATTLATTTATTTTTTITSTPTPPFGCPPPLVRIHSECFTGEVLHSTRCDCGDQLEKAMRLLSQQDRGVIVYLKQEGRGIGLAEKLK